MGSFNKFAVLTASNEGRWLTLTGPDGKPTEDQVLVLGQDSEAYKAGEHHLRRAIIGFLETNGKDSGKTPAFTEFSALEQRRLQATLIKDWSFDEPCTVENVMELFRLAPYVAAEVDEFAGKRERYAANWPASCVPSPKENSASPSQQTCDPAKTEASPASQSDKLLSKSAEQPGGDTQS